MARADLSRTFRRRLNRPAGPRTTAPNPELVAAFEAGEFTRRDTAPGTAGRKAADAVTYRRRTDSRPEGITAREAAGHERPAIREAREVSLLVDNPPRFVIMAGLPRRDVSRGARYDALVSNLVQGHLSPRAFRRRVSAWRPIAGERFLADPDAVLAIVEARRTNDEELFVYRMGRAP